MFRFFVIFLVCLIIPNAEAQLSIGEKAKQELVEITLDLEGIVKVKHVLDSSNIPKQMNFIKGTVSDLTVTSETGVNLQSDVIGDNIGLLILSSSEKTIVEYSLDDALFLENGLWKWDFRYLESINFIIPDGVDLLFLND